jgi:hypothetical protein
MADDRAKKALREVREAIAAVHEGRVDQSGELRFEGVRAYSANRSEIRKLAPGGLRLRKRVTTG